MVQVPIAGFGTRHYQPSRCRLNRVNGPRTNGNSVRHERSKCVRIGGNQTGKMAHSITANPDRSTDIERWCAFAVLALLAFRIAALYANGTDLFFDEAQYWDWSRSLAFGYYSKPPMVAWIIRGATEVCGDSEACVRLPSPIIHTCTCFVIYRVGELLYSRQVGAIAAVVFATLPGVSLSSGIISTDVPLLFFWSLALLALVQMQRSTDWGPGLLLGVALGLGLNAKYAMAWFLLCLAIYVISNWRIAGWLVKDARLYVAILIAALLIAPNVYWNAQHSFATLAHTADNAKWSGSLFNPLKAIEFFGSQFGVFGPVLFATLLTIAWRAWRGPGNSHASENERQSDRLLLSFALPLIFIVTVQAFISRAHPNWAAVSYVAASVLVTAVLVRRAEWGWLKSSLTLHVALLVLLAGGTTLAGRIALPFGAEPFARTLGWKALANSVRETLDQGRRSNQAYTAVLSDDRSLTTELLYYMRDESTPVVAWRGPGRPRDHYELTRPLTPERAGRVLMVSISERGAVIATAFQERRDLGVRTIPAGRNATRQVTFTSLSGIKAP